MGAHFRPKPYFPNGIVAAVRCELGEDAEGSTVPKTHYVEYNPGGKLFCHGPGVRPDGKLYGGCGRENWDGVMSIYLMTGQKTRCMDVMESFRDLVRIKRRHQYAKIPRHLRQTIPKDLIEAAWPDWLAAKMRSRNDHGKPGTRLVTPEQIDVAAARARERMIDRFYYKNRESVEGVSSRCAKAGLFRSSYNNVLDKDSYFRSISLLKVVDGDDLPLTRGGALWTGKRWAIFMPVQVAAVLDSHLIVAGFMQTNAARSQSRLAVAFGNVLQPCPRYDVPLEERPLHAGSWDHLKKAKPEAITVDGVWTFPHIERHLDKPRFIGRLDPFPFALSI